MSQLSVISYAWLNLFRVGVEPASFSKALAVFNQVSEPSGDVIARYRHHMKVLEKDGVLAINKPTQYWGSWTVTPGPRAVEFLKSTQPVGVWRPNHVVICAMQEQGLIPVEPFIASAPPSRGSCSEMEK